MSIKLVDYAVRQDNGPGYDDTFMIVDEDNTIMDRGLSQASAEEYAGELQYEVNQRAEVKDAIEAALSSVTLSSRPEAQAIMHELISIGRL
jgi:hypothetical protein